MQPTTPCSPRKSPRKSVSTSDQKSFVKKQFHHSPKECFITDNLVKKNSNREPKSSTVNKVRHKIKSVESPVKINSGVKDSKTMTPCKENSFNSFANKSAVDLNAAELSKEIVVSRSPRKSRQLNSPCFDSKTSENLPRSAKVNMPVLRNSPRKYQNIKDTGKPIDKTESNTNRQNKQSDVSGAENVSDAGQLSSVVQSPRKRRKILAEITSECPEIVKENVMEKNENVNVANAEGIDNESCENHVKQANESWCLNTGKKKDYSVVKKGGVNKLPNSPNINRIVQNQVNADKDKHTKQNGVLDTKTVSDNHGSASVNVTSGKNQTEKLAKSSKFWTYVVEPVEDKEKETDSCVLNKELQMLKEGAGNWFVSEKSDTESRRRSRAVVNVNVDGDSELMTTSPSIERAELSKTKVATLKASNLIENYENIKCPENPPGRNVENNKQLEINAGNSKHCEISELVSADTSHLKQHNVKDSDKEKAKENKFWTYVTESVENESESEDDSNIPKELKLLKKEANKLLDTGSMGRRSRAPARIASPVTDNSSRQLSKHNKVNDSGMMPDLDLNQMEVSDTVQNNKDSTNNVDISAEAKLARKGFMKLIETGRHDSEEKCFGEENVANLSPANKSKSITSGENVTQSSRKSKQKEANNSTNNHTFKEQSEHRLEHDPTSKQKDNIVSDQYSDIPSDFQCCSESGEMLFFSKSLAERIKERSSRRSSSVSYNVNNSMVRSRSNSLSSNNAKEKEQKTPGEYIDKKKVSRQKTTKKSPEHLRKKLLKSKSGASIASAKVLSKYKIRKQNLKITDNLQNGYHADDENEISFNFKQNSIDSHTKRSPDKTKKKNGKRFWYYEPVLNNKEDSGNEKLDIKLSKELKALQESKSFVSSDLSDTESRSRSRTRQKPQVSCISAIDKVSNKAKDCDVEMRAENGQKGNNTEEIAIRNADQNKSSRNSVQLDAENVKISTEDKTDKSRKSRHSEEQSTKGGKPSKDLSTDVEMKNSQDTKKDSERKHVKPKKHKVLWEYEIVTDETVSRKEDVSELPNELRSLKCQWNNLSQMHQQMKRSSKLKHMQTSIKRAKRLEKRRHRNDKLQLIDNKDDSVVRKDDKTNDEQTVKTLNAGKSERISRKSDKNSNSKGENLMSSKDKNKNFWKYEIVTVENSEDESVDNSLSKEVRDLKNSWNNTSKRNSKRDPGICFDVTDSENTEIEDQNTNTNGQKDPRNSKIKKGKCFWVYESVTDDSENNENSDIEKLPKALKFLKCSWNPLSDISGHKARSHRNRPIEKNITEEVKIDCDEESKIKTVFEGIYENTTNGQIENSKNDTDVNVFISDSENDDKKKGPVISDLSKRNVKRKQRSFWVYEKVTDESETGYNSDTESLPKELQLLKCSWNRLSDKNNGQRSSSHSRNRCKNTNFKEESEQKQNTETFNDKKETIQKQTASEKIYEAHANVSNQSKVCNSKETSSGKETPSLTEVDKGKTVKHKKKQFWVYEKITDENQSDENLENLPKELQILKWNWNEVSKGKSSGKKSRLRSSTSTEQATFFRGKSQSVDRNDIKSGLHRKEDSVKGSDINKSALDMSDSENVYAESRDSVVKKSETCKLDQQKSSGKKLRKSCASANKRSTSPVFCSNARQGFKSGRKSSPVFNRSPYSGQRKNINSDRNNKGCEHVRAENNEQQSITPEKTGTKVVYGSGYTNTPRGSEPRKRPLSMSGTVDVTKRRKIEESFDDSKCNVNTETLTRDEKSDCHAPLVWEPVGETKNKDKIKLNKSWSLLSEKSVSKLLSSEDDRDSFDGFDEKEVESSLRSDLSFEQCSEIDAAPSDSEHDWIIEDKASDNGEPFEQFVPAQFSSPCKTSNSSWIDACDGYIDKSFKQGTEVSFKSVYYSFTSPRKSPKSGGSARGMFTPEKRNKGETPVKRKVKYVDNSKEVEQIDEDIVFNFGSPQKNCTEFSPLRNVNGAITEDRSPVIAKMTSTPVTLNRKTRLKYDT